MACSWGPSPSTRQVPGSSPGPSAPHSLPSSGRWVRVPRSGRHTPVQAKVEYPPTYMETVDWIHVTPGCRTNFKYKCPPYIQHCMDLQLAVDPYKTPVLFESTDWLSKIHRVSWHISANQISTKHSPTAVVWYEESWLQFLQKSDTW